ncbi:MAG: hypothetical protein LAO77_23095 [Acidobacteriia bacterium]|nr:hypothetical protein [Terriglobia bacterium]
MPRLTLEPTPPLASGDPILVAAFTDAVARYLAGDYAGAAERLLDVRALVATRADWSPFESFLATLEFQLASGALVSAPAAVISAARGAR